MTKFFNVLFIVFIKQLIFLMFFGLAVSINCDGIIIVPIFLIIVYLISYFLHSKTICEKINVDKTKYDIYGFISWLLVGELITFLLVTDSWLWIFLPTTGGFLGGFEYIFVPILLILYLIVLGISKLIIFIIKQVKKQIV